MLMRDLLLSCRQPSLAQPQGVPLLAACTYTSRLQAMARFRFHRLDAPQNLGDMLKGTPLLSCKEPSLARFRFLYLLPGPKAAVTC